MTYREQLAKEIRNALGRHDNPELPVVELVRRLRARIAELEAQQRAGVPDVDALAAFIRKVDGSHRMGAGVLAERICDWWASDAVAVAPTPKAQEQAEHKLSAAGVFKGAEGLRGLLDAQDFWDQQPYGTRLYFGEMANEYLHRDVLRAAVALLDQRQEQAPQPAEGAAILERAWYHKMDDGDYEIFDAKDAKCEECIEVAIVPVTALTAAGGREELDWPQQVFELCNFLVGQGWTMTRATHEAWMLATGDANKYPNPLDALARAALAASQPAQEGETE